MKSLNVLSNHVGSLPAQAVEAFAHGLRITWSRFGQRDTTSVPPEGFIGNPPSLPTSRSYPYTGFSATVDNCESPLRFEILHLTVRNHISSKGIYDFDYVVSENNFGSNPYEKSQSTQNETEYDFKDNLKRVGNNKKTVGSKKYEHYNCQPSVNKVTSGSKGFMHELIIAENMK